MMCKPFIQNEIFKIYCIRPQSGVDKIKLLLNGAYISAHFLEVVKKNNDIRVDSYRDNTIQYYDSEEDKLCRVGKGQI